MEILLSCMVCVPATGLTKPAALVTSYLRGQNKVVSYHPERQSDETKVQSRFLLCRAYVVLLRLMEFCRQHICWFSNHAVQTSSDCCTGLNRPSDAPFNTGNRSSYIATVVSLKRAFVSRKRCFAGGHADEGRK